MKKQLPMFNTDSRIKSNKTDFIKQSCKPSGFTLLEIIITIALALIVLTIIYSSFYFSSRSSASTRADILKKQELMKQFYTFRRQLINLYKAEKGASLLGEKGMRANQSELYFLTSSMENNRGVGEVGYKIQRKTHGNTYLAYTEFPYPRATNRFAILNPQDKWHPASALIKEFNVEYESSNKWLKEWK